MSRLSWASVCHHAIGPGWSANRKLCGFCRKIAFMLTTRSLESMNAGWRGGQERTGYKGSSQHHNTSGGCYP
jgi:hypothetical protein